MIGEDNNSIGSAQQSIAPEDSNASLGFSEDQQYYLQNATTSLQNVEKLTIKMLNESRLIPKRPHKSEYECDLMLLAHKVSEHQLHKASLQADFIRV